jgi:hypothetical protein
MAFFADLTPCSYFHSDLPPLIAVGWLEAGHEYAVGDPGGQVFTRLKEFQQGSWQPSMLLGKHRCDLCRYEGFESHKNFFIPGPGVTYVAPEGIVHYIGCHGYLSPAEFCQAVVGSPGVDTPDYFASLRALGWSPERAKPDERDPKWRRRYGIESVLRARGAAIVEAIEVYRQMNGDLPRRIADAMDLVNDDGIWECTVEGASFVLKADWVDEGDEEGWGATIQWGHPGDLGGRRAAQ